MVNRFIYEGHNQLKSKCHLSRKVRWLTDLYMKGTISLCVNAIDQEKADG